MRREGQAHDGFRGIIEPNKINAEFYAFVHN